MPAPSSALAHSSSHRRRRAKHTAYCLWVPMPCAERIDVLDVEGGVEEQPRVRDARLGLQGPSLLTPPP
ncbi:hypothetical protein CCMSSC00406_0009203 [Pleurotus cornucopiae]|uniref:Uncharacterized protein n=1 Tax=Pleurotus cornucopiae TaxID=5321 RepID=A0ACB7IVH8_PLECO|nr:hypothetical protein CCMSSC00406_0009203 [Pleurotus cornucopiae]